ncbi:uncharacterized protein LOC113337995 [Papaver somniferum]|uniref:uncharacterized protein LOC113337995 n=1 Tax=Papaver somniferum TaxID=3469 RepID=UPI000E6F62F2|nr:uncharacterized protein LOC113337995 [Papaver somniferum]
MAMEYYNVNKNQVKGRSAKEEIFISWQYPQNGFFKINIDGFSNDDGFAGIDGVIRDESGAFVACYWKHIFKNNNNVAEVLAIRDGLRLAVDLGLHYLEVESDSSYVVQLCNEEVQPNWDCFGLLKEISGLKSRFSQVKIQQRYREANKVADKYRLKMELLEIMKTFGLTICQTF